MIEVKDAGGTVATYAYDYQSRRISKTIDSTVTSFVYDDWNPIAEFSGTTLSKSYTWGMDLSGSMQGAGGVGGLLSVNDGSTTYYPIFDGNGNVSEYVDAAGAVVAHYEYDAFGQAVASGTKANDFSHQFSTKQLGAESGLHYYGYRYYDSSNGRWLSRDPIEEEGGMNLYGFVGNDSINSWDKLGEKFADWNSSPETEPYITSQSDAMHSTADADGYVDVGFYGRASIVKGSPCQVEIKDHTGSGKNGFMRVLDFWISGKALLDNVPRKIDNPFAQVMPNRNHEYYYVEDHERHHLRLYHNQYKKMQQAANGHEKSYTTNACANKAVELINAEVSYYTNKSKYDNYDFDYNSYGIVRNPKKGKKFLRYMEVYSQRMQAAKQKAARAASYLSSNCPNYEIQFVTEN